MSVYLALTLGRPLFLEGEAGVGKTSLARAVAGAIGADLIRLQCYEGLDLSQAVYEWDYPRQLLELRILDAAGALNRDDARRELYSDAFLIKRPLLQAIDPARTRPAVLLIDEIDRADEEFEGYLLEMLAEFQITDSRAGHHSRDRAAARHPDVQPHPRAARRAQAAVPLSVDRLSVVRERGGDRARARAARLRRSCPRRSRPLVQSLRKEELYKVPGVSETLDWVAALVALDRHALDPAAVEETIGVVLKAQEDLDALRGERLAALMEHARRCADHVKSQSMPTFFTTCWCSADC